jgi:hypothetical protein
MNTRIRRIFRPFLMAGPVVVIPPQVLARYKR